MQRAGSRGLGAAHDERASDGSARGGAARGIEVRPVRASQHMEPAAPVMPAPVELPAAVDRLAASAVNKLGWQGVVLPEMTMLGRRVVVVARLRTVAHAERLCFGAEPVVDRTTVSTWVWPEFAASAPPQAVDIVGVLGVARHWRTALASAAPFARFCDAGIVLPWSVAMTQDYLSQCLPRARGYGVSVLTADPDGAANLDQPAKREPVEQEQGALLRWISELVYQRVLDTVK
ncbi:MAG: hypothetical protein ACRDRN_28140 [Sciscionella sp.]